MQLNQNAFKTNETTAQAQPAQSILIFGEIDAHGTPAQNEMLKLTASLVTAGHNVETAAPTPNAMTRNIINFRTPHKFAQTTGFVMRYDHVVIFLETLTAPKFRSTTPWGKVKEHLRITKFIHNLHKSGRHVTVIGTKMQRMTAMGITRKTSHIACDYNNAANAIFQNITGNSLRAFDPALAQHTLIEHANFRHSDGKFTALKLRRYLCATQATDAALETLCTLASHPVLFRTSLVKRLKKNPSQTTDYITQTLPPHPVLDMALARDETHNIPTYAAHLLNIFHPNHTYDLATPSGQTAAMDWYHGAAREKLPQFWVPQADDHLPTPDPAPENTMLHHMETFLNNPQHEPTHSLELNRLLHLRRYTYGPTGMAILLAMLNRIQLNNADRMNPWKSKKIAAWFANTPCAIAPCLRRFSHLKTAAPNDHPSACILGLPQQETGLGTNMRMTLQAFEKIGLNFTSNNLETDISQNSIAPKKTHPTGNFTLHHINAERVPMNIMSPRFSHRNDIYHIGYFLWETSKIPPLHRLGTAMVNEVWAPTEFVANLYRDAGAKIVTTVGKALPELDYLTKLAKIARPDPNHFTVFSGFDFHSSVERKNPMSVVHAFQRAFPKRVYPDHRLILKTTPSTKNHWGDPLNQMAQIKNATIRDPRISIIEKMVPLEYLFRLMARAHCVVSTHRGEGFGYLPAYALALSVPTIVTNWGGVTDFCTTKTAFPVDYRLVDVPDGHAIHNAPGAKWAAIDMNDLIQKMLDVFDGYDMAKSRAAVGQATVCDQYSMDRLVKTYQTRLSQIGLI